MTLMIKAVVPSYTVGDCLKIPISSLPLLCELADETYTGNDLFAMDQSSNELPVYVDQINIPNQSGNIYVRLSHSDIEVVTVTALTGEPTNPPEGLLGLPFLVGFPFRKGSGTSEDSIVGNSTASLVGDMQWLFDSDLNGYCVGDSSISSNDYINISNPPTPGTAYSFVFRAKTNGLSNYITVFKFPYSYGKKAVSLYKTYYYGCIIAIKNSNLSYLEAFKYVQLDTWAHFAAIVNGSQYAIYMNGTQLTGLSSGSPGTSYQSETCVSLYNYTSASGDVRLRDLAVINKALTSEEVSLLYNTPLPYIISPVAVIELGKPYIDTAISLDAVIDGAPGTVSSGNTDLVCPDTMSSESIPYNTSDGWCQIGVIINGFMTEHIPDDIPEQLDSISFTLRTFYFAEGHPGITDATGNLPLTFTFSTSIIHSYNWVPGLSVTLSAQAIHDVEKQLTASPFGLDIAVGSSAVPANELELGFTIPLDIYDIFSFGVGDEYALGNAFLTIETISAESISYEMGWIEADVALNVDINALSNHGDFDKTISFTIWSSSPLGTYSYFAAYLGLAVSATSVSSTVGYTDFGQLDFTFDSILSVPSIDFELPINFLQLYGAQSLGATVDQLYIQVSLSSQAEILKAIWGYIPLSFEVSIEPFDFYGFVPISLELDAIHHGSNSVFGQPLHVPISITMNMIQDQVGAIAWAYLVPTEFTLLSDSEFTIVVVEELPMTISLGIASSGTNGAVGSLDRHLGNLLVSAIGVVENQAIANVSLDLSTEASIPVETKLPLILLADGYLATGRIGESKHSLTLDISGQAESEEESIDAQGSFMIGLINLYAQSTLCSGSTASAIIYGFFVRGVNLTGLTLSADSNLDLSLLMEAA